MPGDDLLDDLLVGHAPGDRLDLVAPGAQRLGRRLELLRLAGCDGQRVALGAEHLGEGVPIPVDAPVTMAARSGISGSPRGHLADSRIKPPIVSASCVASCRSLWFSLRCSSWVAARTATARAPPTPQPSARAEDFPAAKGKTLMTLREGLPKGPILAPTTAASLHVGENRVAFALRDRADKLLSGADVALYTTDHDGGNVRGPYLAHTESLKVKPQFESRNTAQDPEAAKTIYVADVPIPRWGKRVITGVARLDGRLVATSGFELTVPRKGQKGLPPEVGDKAIDVHTPTITSVGGDAAKISTRVPPAEPMLQTDFAFASRQEAGRPGVCDAAAVPEPHLRPGRRRRDAGPVGLRRQGDVHPAGDLQQQPRRRRLHVAGQRLAAPTEPWIFVIDRDGKSPIASRARCRSASSSARWRR